MCDKCKVIKRKAAVLFTASFRVRGSIFSELRETFYQVSLLT